MTRPKIHSIPLGIDTTYIIEEERTIMIDGGAPDKASLFKKQMSDLSIDPLEIKLIVLTHAHWDHIGSVKDVQEITGAEIALHHAERDWLENTKPPMPPGITTWGKVLGGILRIVLPAIKIPFAKLDKEISDEGFSLVDYGINGKVIHTPGHSPGSVSVLLESGDAFVGDLAMNGFPLRNGPGLPIFGYDINLIKESWSKLLRLGVKTVFPAHGKPFPAEVMRKAIGI